MRKGLAVVLCSSLLLMSMNNVEASKEVKSKKGALQFVDSEIRRGTKKVDSLSKESQKVESEIKRIDDLIFETNREIQVIEKKIGKNNDDLTFLRYEKGLLVKKIMESKSRMNDVGIETDAFFESLEKQSVSEMEASIRARTEAQKVIQNLIYQEDLQNLNSKNETLKRLEKNKKRLSEDLSIVQSKKTFIEQQKEKKNEMLMALGKKMKSHASDLNALEQTSDELVSVITALQTKEAQRIAAARAKALAATTASSVNYSSDQRVFTTVGNKDFAYPTTVTTRITSYYGPRSDPLTGRPSFHTGIDFPVPVGSPVISSKAGTVITASWLTGYGYTVIVDHGDGSSTLYGHNSVLNVKVGDEVRKGQKIAGAGSTGWSTGPHIHFEIRFHGKHTNPLPYL